MPYWVRWTLLGQAERRLDGGSLDGVHQTYGEAAAEVSSFLRSYADAWRSDDGTHWRARRSPDADLEVRVWIEDLTTDEVCAT
jgi:hypothetical protein